MKLIVLLLLLVFAAAAFGQDGGIPFHVDGIFSTTPNPPFRIFSPAQNPYARRIVQDQFRFVTDLSKIDSEVLKAFHTKVAASEIVNRGKKFNSTDVGTGPRRRFVLAGTAPNLWFILYETGGIGYHHNLIVLSRDQKWHIVAAVAGFLKGNGDPFKLLKEALNRGEFFDQKGFPQY